jgi:NAD(P)H dehydrogenase (quinone)
MFHCKHPDLTEPMRFHVIYAHPVGSSFSSALHNCILDALAQSGHQVDDFDLYAEEFAPVLSHEERLSYGFNITQDKAVTEAIRRLRACTGLVFVFPTWYYGMPAILKGYFDRVWLPGVAFNVVDGRTTPMLQNITRLAVVTTYGSPWWLNTFVFGDPNKKVFTRGIRRLVAPAARTLWLAQYSMDAIDHRQLDRFLTKVTRHCRSF